MLSGASRGDVILTVPQDAGPHIGCSQDNTQEPKTLGKWELTEKLKRAQINKAKLYTPTEDEDAY